MPIVHVLVEVKPESVDAFRAATMANVLESRKESGVLQFDFFQEEGAATKFLLIEIYRDAEAAASHKQTAHYAKWREVVASMMAQPRSSVRYLALWGGGRDGSARPLDSLRFEAPRLIYGRTAG